MRPPPRMQQAVGLYPADRTPVPGQGGPVSQGGKGPAPPTRLGWGGGATNALCSSQLLSQDAAGSWGAHPPPEAPAHQPLCDAHGATGASA